MDYVREWRHPHRPQRLHLHIHALLIFPTDVSAEIPALTCESTPAGRGLRRRHERHRRARIDVRSVTAVEKMGKYISKLAFETAGAVEAGKRGSRTPFQILADAIDTGNERDVASAEWNRQPRHAAARVSNASSSAAGHRVKDEEIAEEDGVESCRSPPGPELEEDLPGRGDLIIATRHAEFPPRAPGSTPGPAFEFEADTTERAVQLDPGDAPFACSKPRSRRRPQQRRERRRSYYRPATRSEATARTARTARTYASSDDLRQGVSGGASGDPS
ncbi:hypothetical protein [Pseudonocardia sp. Ae717_Ps2]|uniref:hypothetical protein n=1 Tax=Pseudonocardia sp. Ae717_Ps2 TaxID=1885573 RepID=UPI0011866E6F|nr:hypothetical protein [Pseudonocardia sp. Ae717_Ps2]